MLVAAKLELTVIVRAPGYLNGLLHLCLLRGDGLLLGGDLGPLAHLHRLGLADQTRAQGCEAPAWTQSYIVTGEVFRAGVHQVNSQQIFAES